MAKPRMRERPIGDLVDALTQLGCNIEPISSTVDGQICPPVKILASGLPGGKTKIAGNISSQFLSALLMVAPYAQAPVEIELTTDLNSKPYIDMTIAIMKDFGVEVEREGYDAFYSSNLLSSFLFLLIQSNPTPPPLPTSLLHPPSAAEKCESKISRAIRNKGMLRFSIFFSKWDVKLTIGRTS